MEDLEYIKKFSKINVKDACKKSKVNRGNLLNNRTTKENIKKVREEIESQIAGLYIKRDSNDNILQDREE